LKLDGLEFDKSNTPLPHSAR